MGASSSNSTSGYCYLCPLSLFDCYADKLDLVEDIQIRLIPPAFTDYLERYGIRVKFVAVLPHNMASTTDGAIQEFKEKSDLLFDLISGLRLCHAGKVITGPLVPAELANSVFSRLGALDIPGLIPMYPEVSTFSSTTIFDLQWPCGYPFGYELQPSDVNIINEIIKELRVSRKEGKQNILFEALSRFHSAYHGNPNDRLIDQIIAFESLYIGDDKELGYKLALRTAFLLTRDEDKRNTIFNNMKKAYDLRGSIVHGSKSVKRPELEVIIIETEEYLRQSIRKFLKLLASGYSLDTLKKGKDKKLAMLDENILKDGALLDSK